MSVKQSDNVSAGRKRAIPSLSNDCKPREHRIGSIQTENIFCQLHSRSETSHQLTYVRHRFYPVKVASLYDLLNLQRSGALPFTNFRKR